MATATKCRRCYECAGQDHHWLDNPDHMSDAPDAANRHAEFVCKHCPATGRDCPDCDGTGGRDGYGSMFLACERCEGEGIVSD